MDRLTQDLLAARDGDDAAFAAFVRATQGEVWRCCAHLVGRDEADDATQDTYARVVRALPRFRGEAAARTWLLSIARRACADVVRGRVRRRRYDAVSTARAEAASADVAGALGVTALLDTLDRDQRTAFVLTQLHGLSYEECAVVCGVPIGTIRSRVARARATLVERVRAADAV